MTELFQLSFWNILFLILAGYLIGSIPSGVLLARVFGGPDPRTVGSTHTGATNVFRHVHPLAGVLTGAFDFAKGALAVWMALKLFGSPWVIPFAGAPAVAGHCWPVFLNFRGGMGVATAAGLVLWQFPQIILLFAAAYLLVNHFLRHQARTMMVISAFIPLMLLPFHPSPEKMALAAGIAVVLIIRWSSDFHRVYEG